MSVFQDTREAIAGKLTAAGVANVTLDPRGQLPCVLVGLFRITGTEGIGGWTVELAIEVLTPPPGDVDALAWMFDQLEPILVTFPAATAEPTTITRNDQDVPAYVVTLTTSIPNPNC